MRNPRPAPRQREANAAPQTPRTEHPLQPVHFPPQTTTDGVSGGEVCVLSIGGDSVGDREEAIHTLKTAYMHIRVNVKALKKRRKKPYM